MYFDPWLWNQLQLESTIKRVSPFFTEAKQHVSFRHVSTWCKPIKALCSSHFFAYMHKKFPSSNMLLTFHKESRLPEPFIIPKRQAGSTEVEGPRCCSSSATSTPTIRGANWQRCSVAWSYGAPYIWPWINGVPHWYEMVPLLATGLGVHILWNVFQVKYDVRMIIYL